MSFSADNLKSLIKVAVENRASDVHLRSGEVPCFRINGELYPIKSNVFTEENIQAILNIINNHKNTESLENEIDGSYEISNVARLRFNYFKYNSQSGIIFRLINSNVPTLEDLGLRSIIKEISLKHRGLVLVTGATGSGKSSTLAAMINYINRKRSCHIISIEDPIEFLHTQEKSRITQREVGTDTESFKTGLRSALRQDPDVILIGEMRDPETVSIALKAAETGHLVLSTIHTTDATKTIGRIISLFSAEEQKEVRKRLADNLAATISQRLMKSSKKSSIVCQEIMVNTEGIKECILGKEDLSRIKEIISKGKSPGGVRMQTFDQHLMELLDSGKITKEVALENCSNQIDFLRSLSIN